MKRRALIGYGLSGLAGLGLFGWEYLSVHPDEEVWSRVRVTSCLVDGRPCKATAFREDRDSYFVDIQGARDYSGQVSLMPTFDKVLEPDGADYVRWTPRGWIAGPGPMERYELQYEPFSHETHFKAKKTPNGWQMSLTLLSGQRAEVKLEDR